MRSVLLTGFDAFGGADVNPSWLAVSALDGALIAGHRVVAAQLPTAFGASAKTLAKLLKAHRPALVVCVGQAGGRAALSLERVAINLDDARIPDNSGAQPIDQAIAPRGPAAYFSTLPIKAMLLALQRADVAAEVSQTAGTFVCNHVFYALMHALGRQRSALGERMRGGFVHVPCLPSQVAIGEPSMALEEMVRGLHTAIECAASVQTDIAYGAGALD